MSVNVGGAVIPAALSIWLIATADEAGERMRAILASVLVAGAVLLGSVYLPNEPETMFMDPKLIYGFAAGIIAYLAGRSRRSAFIGGTLGIVLSDLAHFVVISRSGLTGTTAIGGAGAFDVIVIAGIFAVMIAELVGETREKLQGGPELGPNRPEGLYEFSKELGHEGHKPDVKNGEKTGQNRQKAGDGNE
jgi:peptidoglycan/LPS O-acetylase OafA/YrhL